VLAVGVILSVVVHFAFFSLYRGFWVPEFSLEASTLASVELPPEVEIPPPPEAVARPATPVVATVDVNEEITIAPTTFEANPTESLAPPPARVAASDPSERPHFIPFDTPPRLRNGAEIERLLITQYPLTLRNAGVGGNVVLWMYLDVFGRVQRTVVKESSGYELLDAAAERVGARMLFDPAKNRDKPTPVWVSQAITFAVH
jgi:TonB family protein